MSLLRAVPLLLVLAACASGGPSRKRVVEPTMEQTTRVQSTEGAVELRTTRSDPTNEFAIAATPDKLWKVMPVVFAQLEVPVTMRVPAQRVMGNRAFHVRRKLGGVHLGRYLDCGTRMGVINAETYEVTLRLEMHVLGASADDARLATVVEGTAKPVDVSGAPVFCTTTGQLEKRLVAMMTEQVERS